MNSGGTQGDAAVHLPELDLAGASRIASRAAKVILVFLVVSPLAMLAVPWQQSISASGSIVAIDPLERPQTIDAPVAGRVVHFTVRENSYLNRGDLICEIVDINPLLSQQLAQEEELVRMEIEAAELQVQTYRSQMAFLNDALDRSIDSAQARIAAAMADALDAEARISAAQADLTQKQLRFERVRDLFEGKSVSVGPNKSPVSLPGLASAQELEIAERELRQAEQALESAKAILSSRQRMREFAEQELERTRADNSARVQSVHASLREGEQKLQSIQAKLVGVGGRIARQQQQRVLAPRSGWVNRLFVATDGEVVNPKDPLIELVPDTRKLGAQVWVSGNDQPLIKPGDPVRLQFEGWPAVQFSGWPAVAVGTFGGRVLLIDPRDDGKGYFRLLVEPDPNEPVWPDERYLRQGVKAKGFVLLRTVPLGYEFWRQLNGFPPTVAMEPPKDDVARKRLK